jgi:hypothetical protein
MVTAKRATKLTVMARVRQDTTATTMAMDVDDDDDDDEGDNASSTTCNEGDIRDLDNGKDACTLTATTSAHRRRQLHS